MSKLCVLSAAVVLLGEVLLPTSPLKAEGWVNPPEHSENTSCNDGTTGTTGLRFNGSFGNWVWEDTQGDENTFSITVVLNESGSFDTGIFIQFHVAFFGDDQPCSISFWGYDYYPPDPPPARFVATSACTVTAEGLTDGSSEATVSFEDLDNTRTAFQVLTLNVAPQTIADSFTYTIDFVCDESDGPGSGGDSWDIDLNHYLTTAESSLPNTL